MSQIPAFYALKIQFWKISFSRFSPLGVRIFQNFDHFWDLRDILHLFDPSCNIFNDLNKKKSKRLTFNVSVLLRHFKFFSQRNVTRKSRRHYYLSSNYSTAIIILSSFFFFLFSIESLNLSSIEFSFFFFEQRGEFLALQTVEDGANVLNGCWLQGNKQTKQTNKQFNTNKQQNIFADSLNVHMVGGVFVFGLFSRWFAIYSKTSLFNKKSFIGEKNETFCNHNSIHISYPKFLAWHSVSFSLFFDEKFSNILLFVLLSNTF